MNAAVATAPAASTADVWRVRHAAAALALVALAFVQQPGRILGDTKLDLVVDPGAFLGRAAHLWDPEGAFGQVQNQSYGYFFPMGPFFWLGDAVGLDGWVTQRLWWALILVTAFLGVVKLCEVLGIGSPWSRVAGGIAFAVSPRILTILGPISIEAWPSALAPWVLIPLVIGAVRGSPIRAAALSALAVACVGGVNAAATAAVLPLGALWLLTLAPGARRRRLMLWWPVFVLVGTAWWLVPLLVLGQYSPPFLDYIESAQVTTFPATMVDALRGTTHWVPYVSEDSVAGRMLISNAVLIANSVVLVGLGLVGLGLGSNPHRRWLGVGLCTGLVLVTMGHRGSPEGLFAPEVQGWLDQALAPLRNTHKFDVVVRLPLVLGLAHVLADVKARRRDRPGRTLSAWGVAVLACSALIGSTVPAWTGSLPSRGHFDEVPGYWSQTAEWLGDHDDGRRALLLPGSPFGSYLWGEPRDEPMQPLATSPWAVRNAIPLAPGGNIEALDAIEARLAVGVGSAGLAPSLRRMGIGFLVVRNDLTRAAGSTDPVLLHATLESSPGIWLAESFGPPVGGAPILRNRDARAFVNAGWQDLRPAVEIYRVAGAGDAVRMQAWNQVPTVVGGPESLLALDELGELAGESVIMAEDVPGAGPPGPVVLTDGRRRQEVAFGRIVDNRSASLGEGDPYVLSRPVHQYADQAVEQWLTAPRLLGAERIFASSSLADANTTGPLEQAAQPWSAFDGDPLTAWVSGPPTLVDGRVSRPWIQVDLETPTQVTRVELQLGEREQAEREVVVSTDRGAVDARLQPGGTTTVTLPEGLTSSIRIDADRTGPASLSLAEVDLGETAAPSRPLVLPVTPAAWGVPDRVLIDADDGYRSGCVVVKDLSRCRSGADRWGEDGRTLDRILTLPEASTWSMALTAQAFGGPGLDALLQRERVASAAVSSHLVRAPEVGAPSAVDGDPATTWIAAAADEDPTISLNWLGPRRVEGLGITLSKLVAASPVTRVRVELPDAKIRRGRVVDGQVTFRYPVRTDSMTIHLLSSKRVGSIDNAGDGSVLPIGIGEITVPGTALFPRPLDTQTSRMFCGSGPTLSAAGLVRSTALVASQADLASGHVVPAVPCGPQLLQLGSGEQRLSLRGTDAVRPLSLLLEPPGAPVLRASDEDSPAAQFWRPTARSVTVAQSGVDRLLGVAENHNAGWQARTGDRLLSGVRVNGWQQGWVVPAGVGTSVSLVYAPDSAYRSGLLIGAGALMLLAAGALAGGHRWQDAGLPPLSPGSGRVTPALVLAATALLVAGPWGLLAAVCGVGLALTFHRRWRVPGSWACLPFWLVAGAIAAARPWGSDAGWAGVVEGAQLLAMLSVGVATGVVLGDATRLPQRMAGRSTNR